MSNLAPLTPPEQQPPSYSKRRRALLLLIFTLLTVAVYFFFVASPLALYFWVFYLLLAGFLLTYLFYNRFFTLDGVTVDSMPTTMPLSDREAFVAAVATRKARSAWMLYVILPLSVTLAIDLLFLYAGDLFGPLVTALRNLF